MKKYYNYAEDMVWMAERTRQFWETPEQIELGERIIMLGHTLMDNITEGFGPVGLDDLKKSAIEFSDKVLGTVS